MGITYRKFQERTRDVHLLLPGCHVLLLIATSGCIVASSTGAARGGHPPFQPPLFTEFSSICVALLAALSCHLCPDVCAEENNKTDFIYVLRQTKIEILQHERGNDGNHAKK